MFTKFFVLLSLVTLLYAHGIVDPANEDLGRIYGGVEASIDRIPYQVSLQRNGYHMCGGTIYKANIIVTAGHCVYDVDPRQFSVRAGSDIHSTGGSIIPVAAMVLHEQYDNHNLNNDVAVLLLSFPLNFGPHVKAISLASKAPNDGAKSLVSGWGETEYDFQPSNLRSVTVNIISRKKCARIFDHGTIKRNNICAAAPGKDACQGDSGGPLVHNGRLVGIVSWGYDCADAQYPGVYANVAELRSWIEKSTAKLISTDKEIQT